MGKVMVRLKRVCVQCVRVSYWMFLVFLSIWGFIRPRLRMFYMLFIQAAVAVPVAKLNVVAI